MRIKNSTVFAASFLAMSVILRPVYAQGQPPAVGNSSPEQDFKSISLQLKNAVGNALGKSDQSGVTTTAQIDPQPSGGVLSGGGDTGTPPRGGGRFSGGTPPIDIHVNWDGSNRGGGGRRGGGGAGNGSGPGGPPSDNTIPCGTPQFQCYTSDSGFTYFGVPGTSFQGMYPFTPAGPWIPTGPVARLDPVAK